VNSAELALHHQRLGLRAAHIQGEIAHREEELAGSPEVSRLEGELAATRATARELELQLRARERQVEARRARLRARERDLMSGRVSNPSELMRLDQEVEELKSSVRREEDEELELMGEQERLGGLVARLERDLEAARNRAAEAAPQLRSRLERDRSELAAVEAERRSAWAGLPPEWRATYERIQSRTPNPVAEVVGAQCQACRVGVTSSGMQALRRGELVTCDNCGRILVVA
jgi:predicted  nucleic acid-binding Zn-ribbon protein